jgi:hypothetical protein
MQALSIGLLIVVAAAIAATSCYFVYRLVRRPA